MISSANAGPTFALFTRSVLLLHTPNGPEWRRGSRRCPALLCCTIAMTYCVRRVSRGGCVMGCRSSLNKIAAWDFPLRAPRQRILLADSTNPMARSIALSGDRPRRHREIRHRHHLREMHRRVLRSLESQFPPIHDPEIHLP